jgi:hypothetical protein
MPRRMAKVVCLIVSTVTVTPTCRLKKARALDLTIPLVPSFLADEVIRYAGSEGTSVLRPHPCRQQ